MANCFIYRIAAFGQVNYSLLPHVLLPEQGVVTTFSPSVPSRPQSDCFAFRHGPWSHQYHSTCKTRYCHGLWSGVASQPLANCFIYRIVAFGRVKYLISISSQQYLISISAVPQQLRFFVPSPLSLPFSPRLPKVLLRKSRLDVCPK